MLVGGITFGWLEERWGRRPSLLATGASRNRFCPVSFALSFSGWNHPEKRLLVSTTRLFTSGTLLVILIGVGLMYFFPANVGTLIGLRFVSGVHNSDGFFALKNYSGCDATESESMSRYIKLLILVKVYLCQL